MRVRTVSVIGAGTMGAGIAQTFATHGYEVRLSDAEPGALEAAQTSIARRLDRDVEKERLTPEDRKASLARIRAVGEWEAAVEGAELVVEAVPEQEALKRRLFRGLGERASPEALLASNTSSISITALASETSRPERVVGMHFMNPVPVMELVEVVRGLETSDEAVRTVIDVASSLGKTAVEVNDAPGFVSNRVLMPMINEAIFAYMEGVAEPEAIDAVMRLGMRHPMGPLELADLIGLDVCLSVLEVLHRELGDDRYRPCPLLRKYVAAGRLGRKSGRGFHVHDA